MRTLGLATVLLGILATGCGDDGPDIGGMFAVSYHTENEMGCTEGPPVTDPPYFQITKEEFFGAEYYAYAECTSADPTSCTSFGLFGLSFQQPEGDGWVGVMNVASGSGDTCYLSHVDASAMLQDGGGLRIEVTRYGQEAMLAGDACSAEEAESRGTGMPCEGFEVVVGTKVP